MYGNGAWTGGVTAYQAKRQLRARIRVLTAAIAVALGTTTPSTRGFPNGATPNSTTAEAASVASV